MFELESLRYYVLTKIVNNAVYSKNRNSGPEIFELVLKKK